MNIFGKKLMLLLLAMLIMPSNMKAMPSLFNKAIAYMKGHPYLCVGIALGISGFSAYKFYNKYKSYCEKMKREREALRIAREAETATGALQEHLDGEWPRDIGRHLDWYIDLLKKGANPDTKGKNGTILTLIPRIQYWDRADNVRGRVMGLCALLIEKKADLNLTGRSEQTPLMLAAEFGSIDMLRLLLKHGANPNLAHRETLETALMLVMQDVERKTICRLSYYDVIEDIVKDFLAHGADPNMQDSDGNTALIHAVNYVLKNRDRDHCVGRALRKTVILLLNHGANVNLKNNRGQTAIDLARAKGDQKMLDLITAYSNFKAIENDPKMFTSWLPREIRETISRYITQV